MDFYFIPEMLNQYVTAVQEGRAVFSFTKEARGARDEACFHCSDTLKDRRLRIFKRIGAPREPMSVISLRRFLLGDMVEAITREAVIWGLANMPDFKDWKATFQGHVEFPEWETRGSYDILLEGPPGSVIMDIKSCHSGKIDYIKRGEHDLGYLGQLTSYKMGLARQGKTISEGIVVYIDKDTMATHPDPLPRGFEDVVMSDYAALMDDWKRYKDTKVVPAEVPFRVAKRSGVVKAGQEYPEWTCDPRYCEFWKNCPTVKAFWEAHSGRPTRKNKTRSK